MNETLKKLLTNGRVITLLIFIIFAIVAINPQFDPQGVAIRSVTMNSSAALAGIENPKPTMAPTRREVIIAMGNLPIKTIEDYNSAVANLKPKQTITIQTNKDNFYSLTTKSKIVIVGYENITEEVVVNETTNETKRVTREVPKTEEQGIEPLGLSVSEAPSSNLKKGLDLQGGTRVVLQPETPQTQEDIDLIISNMQERLNVYGLSDVVVKSSGDLSGNQYVIVEIAGANEEEVKDLLAKQGKFEAIIGNTTVFRGGTDITYVCRSADCSGIDPRVGCKQNGADWFCGFSFAISLSPEAAQRQADATGKLQIVADSSGSPILSDNIRFYLDDKEVDSLQIATEISIRGSGSGISQQDAITNTLESMKRQQTVLMTGSLPVKMNIVKTDNLSASLGKQFIDNALLVGLVALIAVCVVILLMYRTLKVAIPMILSSCCELILIFGLAALIGWNLDLAAIAGVIVAIGTGVNDQIVITDETFNKSANSQESWLKRFKKAFFIIMAAYATMVVAMIPLLFAGAGLLKGFALTSIMAISFGVFITRPAYAAVLKILLKE